MSAALESTQLPLATEGFDVRTTRCDEVRANLRVSGTLDGDGAVILGQVIDGHLRAGRRYLRLHIGNVRGLGREAVAVIADAHARLLARRGTMILTGVSATMELRLRAATPGSPLLLVSPTAAEAVHSTDAVRSSEAVR